MTDTQTASLERLIGELTVEVRQLREQREIDSMRINGLVADVAALKDMMAKERQTAREEAARQEGRTDVVRWAVIILKNDTVRWVGSGLVALIGLKAAGI